MSQPFDDCKKSFSQKISAEELLLGELEFNLCFLSDAARFRQPDGSYLVTTPGGKSFNVELGSGFPPRLRGTGLARFFKEVGLEAGEVLSIDFSNSVAMNIYSGAEKNSSNDIERESDRKILQEGKNDFPLNMVLYGPPGTGKTHKTAQYAVEICDGSAPISRGELMARYEELRRNGRISFVTFHQSYGYEDFVEGLRPEMSEGQINYRVRPGVFRDMCDTARRNTFIKPGISGKPLKERSIFKMSLGSAGTEEGRQVFQECITRGIVLMGWGGSLDFSDCQSPSEILKRAKDSEFFERPELDARFVGALKDEIQPGDIIIASHGNASFQAIGEVTGGYEFIEIPLVGKFHQARAVRWLVVYENRCPVEKIFNQNFTMHTLYRLDPAGVNFDVLENLLVEQQFATNLPFVFIIDEINRANLSKVFGELITLLESDKREGRTNALTLKLPYSGDDFCVPPNLHVIGTMNTADRSIALLDTALRRRFEFEELRPDVSVLPEEPVGGVDLRRLLIAINERIEYLYDRDHTIGHAYFIDCRSLADIDAVFRRKVIPLLQEYFYEDWSKVRAVLNDSDGTFVKVEGGIPSGLGALLDEFDVRPRYRINSAPFSLAAFVRICE